MGRKLKHSVDDADKLLDQAITAGTLLLAFAVGTFLTSFSTGDLLERVKAGDCKNTAFPEDNKPVDCVVVITLFIVMMSI